MGVQHSGKETTAKSDKPVGTGALGGIRVVELTSHLAGPLCAMILADMGADVVKIERPGNGDETRQMPPFIDGQSAAFTQLNRNKRSVTLDLKLPSDLSLCQSLVSQSDVFIENFRPGTAERLGLGYHTLSSRNINLVYCSISGFGQTGPYRAFGGFDLMAQAMSGLMSICGEVDGAPLRLPIPISDICTGLYGAIGILAALNARTAIGRGQHIDVSLFDTAISLGIYEAAEFFTTGNNPKRLGQAHRGSAPYQAFQTRDGWIVIGAASQSLWERLCVVLEADRLINDRRFLSNADRVEHHSELVATLAPYLRQHDSAHWLATLAQAGIPAGPVNTYDVVYSDPQTTARQAIVRIGEPASGERQVLALPIKLSATPSAIRRPAPRLGQHTVEIVAELQPEEESNAQKDSRKIK